MAVTADDVRAFAPELAGVSNTTIGVWLSLGAQAIDSDTFGSDADNALLLYAAHQCVRSSGGASGTVGPVTQRSVGDVSVSTAAPTNSLDVAGLKSTAYGQGLWQLMRLHTAGGSVVI